MLRARRSRGYRAPRDFFEGGAGVRIDGAPAGDLKRANDELQLVSDPVLQFAEERFALLKLDPLAKAGLFRLLQLAPVFDGLADNRGEPA